MESSSHHGLTPGTVPARWLVVVVHVSLRGFRVMVPGLRMMGVGEMGMVAGFFVIAILVMLRSFMMVLGRRLMVFCGVSMMLGRLFCVFHNVSLDVAAPTGCTTQY
jgi:hypothetical protein